MPFFIFASLSRAVWAAALAAALCLPALAGEAAAQSGFPRQFMRAPGLGDGQFGDAPSFERQRPTRAERRNRNRRLGVPRQEFEGSFAGEADFVPPRKARRLKKRPRIDFPRQGIEGPPVVEDEFVPRKKKPRRPRPELADRPPLQCGPGEVFSERREACVCRKGFDRVRGECVRHAKRRQPPVIVVVPPPPPPVVIAEPPPPPPPPAVSKKPPVEVSHSLPPLPKPKPNLALAPAACLPPDLFDLLEATYGRPPAAGRCEAACLAKPDGVSEPVLAELSRRYGVEWCESCIRLAGYLPLSEIRKIEALAGVTFCMEDGARMCSAPGYARVEPAVTKVKVLEIIRQLPATLGKEGDIAVVIGNETYENGIIENANASSDADSVMTLLTEQLGYRKENIIDLRNATLADLRRVFGGPDGTPGELARLYGSRETGDVFVYVSSHGLREAAEGKNYVLPVDAREDDLASTALSLGELYDSLGRVGAKTMLLALESSFAEKLTPFISPPNLPESEADVMPETPVPGLVVLTASDRDQKPLDDPEVGIGLFTRYLIEAMAGKADQGPVGNGDKRLDAVELYVYTANMVRTAARKTLGLEQKPQLSKVDNVLIGKLASR